MNMQGQLTDAKAALKYMTGGKAFITLVSQTSGSRFTYKIEATDNDPNTYFVSLLNGPDNWSNYRYIGLIKNGNFFRTAKSFVTEDAPSYIGFKFCYEHIKAGDMNGFEVWHEGKCGRCGRKLTVPSSIADGFGPECIGMLGSAVAIAPAPVAVNGQRNLNFDGSKRAPRKSRAAAAKEFVQKHDGVVVAGVAAPVPTTVTNVGNIDAEIRRRITEYKADAPENYYMDGELDEQEAFNVAYNKFRVQIQSEGK